MLEHLYKRTLPHSLSLNYIIGIFPSQLEMIRSRMGNACKIVVSVTLRSLRKLRPSDQPTDKPNNQPTNQPTDRHEE